MRLKKARSQVSSVAINIQLQGHQQFLFAYHFYPHIEAVELVESNMIADLLNENL